MNKVTESQVKLIEDNLKLAYYISNKWNIKLQGRLEKDDITGNCLVGLTKATINFNIEKGNFCTFAVRVMENEILMALRKVRKKENISIKTFTDIGLAYNMDQEVQLDELSFLMDKQNNIEDWINIDHIQSCYNKINKREKEIMGLYILDHDQKRIGVIKNISQSYVSRLIKRGQKQLRKELNII